jgi:hypothetical protein
LPILDRGAVNGDGPETQLRIPRHGQLPDHHHIPGAAECRRDSDGDGHAAARDRQHHGMWQSVLCENLPQALTRITTIPKPHHPEPS